MTDQPFPDRVLELRRRWDADRGSRLFLQLAEEYRHLGRLREALDVLDAGLGEHPGYLSALVAKGRCHLELGEAQAAREALERVVRQDGTQAVASKLLVRAYFELGEIARARERLALYALLHENDPDVAELRLRLEAPEPAPRGREPEAVRERGVDMVHGEAAAAGEDPASPARSEAMNEEIFDLGPPARTARPLPPIEDLFGLYREPEAAGVEAPPAGPAEPAEPVEAVEPVEPDGERIDEQIFPGLGSLESRRRWAAAFAVEGVFDPRLFTAASSPASLKAPRIETPHLETPAAAAPSASTVTLAELYLRQGHREEAARILGEVLRREPENAAARRMLDGIEAPAAPTAAPAPAAAVAMAPTAAAAPIAEAPAGPPEAAPMAPEAKERRKIQVLSAYLDRLRRWRAPDVS